MGLITKIKANNLNNMTESGDTDIYPVTHWSAVVKKDNNIQVSLEEAMYEVSTSQQNIIKSINNNTLNIENLTVKSQELESSCSNNNASLNNLAQVIKTVSTSVQEVQSNVTNVQEQQLAMQSAVDNISNNVSNNFSVKGTLKIIDSGKGIDTSTPDAGCTSVFDNINQCSIIDYENLEDNAIYFITSPGNYKIDDNTSFIVTDLSVLVLNKNASGEDKVSVVSLGMPFIPTPTAEGQSLTTVRNPETNKLELQWVSR